MIKIIIRRYDVSHSIILQFSGLLATKISILLLAVCPLFSACVNTKKAIYFNDIPDSTISTRLEDLEPVIQKNDLLSISVTSLNPKATEIFNTPNSGTGQVAMTAGYGAVPSGYLVDQEGYIRFPVLGQLKAAGVTKKALAENISKSLISSKLLLDPIVNVRFLNYRVSVLGEVARPTVVNVVSEKISLLEAIGMAGDMTLYARRDNVLLLREEEGKRIIKRLNLNSTELLTSPYFYLKSNDIVYVEPNKARVSSTNNNTTQWVPVLISSVSLIFLVVDRIIR